MGEEKWVRNMMDLTEELYKEAQYYCTDAAASKKIKDLFRRIENNYNTFESRYLDFREISDHIYDGIHIADGEGRVVFVNKAYIKMSGIQPEEIYGRKVGDIAAEGILYKNAVTMDVIKTGKQVSINEVTLRSGKELLITGEPIFDENGKVKLVVVNDRDMSDLRKLEKQVHKMKDEVLRAEEEIMFFRDRQISGNKIIFNNKEMKSIMEVVHSVAKTDVTVLITGETGTGKELIANEIYFHSNRKGKPFIKVNCAAIPAELLESELFGYEGGAFTDAKRQGKIGLMELANGGTLLLDEIGDMPFRVQAKLLRALQEREIIRVGGNKQINLDIRVLATTNKDLQKAVLEGTFRGDLYYRLNVVPVRLLPLRERKEDIPHLITAFLNMYNRKHNKQVQMESTALRLLMDYQWPGNIRELENLIERLVVINKSGTIQEENVITVLDLDKEGYLGMFIGEEIPLKTMVQRMERAIIMKYIKKTGSINRASARLGLSEPALSKKCKTLKIDYKKVIEK